MTVSSLTNPASTSQSAMPVRKVALGGMTGAFVTLIVLILNLYVLPSDKKVPAELSTAATTVLTFIVSYLVPSETRSTSESEEEAQ